MELPWGFDRADGLSGRLGTATNPEAILASGPDGQLTTVGEIPIEELPDSPEIERGEQATITKTFQMSWAEGLNRIAYIGRGLVVTDSYENVWLVLSAHLKHLEGGRCHLTVVMEGKSFDSPPDQFTVTPVELGINIIKHPRYFYAFFGDGYGSITEQQNQMVIRLLQDYFENTSANYRTAIIDLLNNSLGTPAGDGLAGQPPPWRRSSEQYDADAKVAGTDMAKRAAMEIVQKYWRGEETPYIIGYEVRWSRFSFTPIPLNPGGYVENPMTEAEPQLPEYFFSYVDPPDPNFTIFDQLSIYNPQCYSLNGLPGGTVNISWLRKADEIEFERTWFKTTSTWSGSVLGLWDTELYTQEQRPQVSGDYLQIHNP